MLFGAGKGLLPLTKSSPRSERAAPTTASLLKRGFVAAQFGKVGEFVGITVQIKKLLFARLCVETVLPAAIR